ncbi:hypothetical protein Tco_0547605 [Tanacetum coccineum]
MLRELKSLGKSMTCRKDLDTHLNLGEVRKSPTRDLEDIYQEKTGQINESSVEAVKAMSQPEVTIAGHCLKLTDIKLTDTKIVREFKRPAGVTEEQMDASSDGDVLVIMDLGADDSLFEAGFAREVVNRVQKLRKKSCLHWNTTDSVEQQISFCPDSTNQDTQYAKGTTGVSAFKRPRILKSEF